jgi:hypothetical protein
MKPLFHLLALAGVLIFSSTTFAAAPELPTLVKATYKVYRSGLLIGHDEEIFERNGDRYRIVSETRADGALKIFFRDRFVLTSEGRIVANRLQPTAYRSERNDPTRNLAAEFDWDKGVIRSVRNNQSETFDLPAGTQDRLSAMYQFMLNPPRGDSVTAWMSQGKKAEPYLYLKQGEPVIRTPAGDLDTVHFMRDAKAGESKAQLWLAKTRYYLPVRIVFEDKNGAFEQQLVELVIQ